MYKFIDLDTGLPAALNKIKTWVNTKLATKQDTLVSGTNIKTVGGVSLLGSGDVPVSTTSSSSVSVLFVGNSLTPVAYLGKQIVSGTNFAFLCHSTLVTEEPVVSMQVVVINQDLEGNATLTNIVTVDPADFN